MKKIMSIISTMCLVMTMIPFSSYVASITPEISIEEFSEQLVEMQEEYEDEPLSNRLIVKSERRINEFDSVDIVEGYNDLHIVQFDNSKSANEALGYYNDSKYIEYAEPDKLISTMEYEANSIEPTQLSHSYGNHLSWGSEAIAVDDYIDYLTEDEYPEIVVGVIDTGIDLDHEFLQRRIIETGFNVSTSGDVNSENDDHGHGTHVAGIVVDNTTENVKLKGYKVLSSEGSGTTSAIILGIQKAIEDDVDVINMSLGGKGSTQALIDVVNQAYNQGITVCVSSGNSATNASKYEPANIECCITVGAHDKNGATPYWSNFGECVDIIAPGVSIYSSYNDGSYTSLNGTSMACPFVSAASAMLLTNNVASTPHEVVSTLQWYAKTNKYEELFLQLGSISTGVNVTPRTIAPKISVDSGNYSNSVTVELTCSEQANIYYTLDGSRATESSTLYTEPIVIDKISALHAIAVADGKIRSLQSVANYYITAVDNIENYVIDENGTLIQYNGSSQYLTVPDEINGITVSAIGNKVFYKKNIVLIKLPDSCNTIGEYAFDHCESLTTVYAKKHKVC